MGSSDIPLRAVVMIGEGAIEEAVKGRLRTGEGGQMVVEEVAFNEFLDVA